MRTLNIEKTEKTKRFAKTKQFLACTLLSVGLIFGSGCKDNVEPKPVVKEQVVQEQKQEIKLNIEKTYFNKTFKVNEKNNLVTELKVGESFDFNGDIYIFQNYFPSEMGSRRVKLVKADDSNYEFLITDNNYVIMPLNDGRYKIRENGFNEKHGHKVILNKNETKMISALWGIQFAVKGKKGDKYEIEINRQSDELLRNVDGKDIITAKEDIYSTGGKKSYCIGYHEISNDYAKTNSGLELVRQVIAFNNGLDLSNENLENNNSIMKDWLKNNTFVMLLGHKFNIEYLVSDDSKLKEGVFRLTDSKNSQNVIYVTSRKPYFNYNHVYDSNVKGVGKNFNKMKEYNVPYKGVNYSNVLDIVSNGKVTKWKIRAFTGRTEYGRYVTATGGGNVVMNYDEFRGFELLKQ